MGAGNTIEPIKSAYYNLRKVIVKYNKNASLQRDGFRYFTS
jgi:hypothetical protein